MIPLGLIHFVVTFMISVGTTFCRNISISYYHSKFRRETSVLQRFKKSRAEEYSSAE